MILILCGKSCTGKDAIAKSLTKRFPIDPIISYTTRPKRDGETDGVEYHFVDDKAFMDIVNSGEMLEYKSYTSKKNGKPCTWYYGTKYVSPKDLRYDRIVILEPDGVKAFLRHYGEENCFVVYVRTKDVIRRARYEHRENKFDIDTWNKREEEDVNRFYVINEVYHMTIDNDGLDEIRIVANRIYSTMLSYIRSQIERW